MLYYVCGYFACVDVCAPLALLVPHGPEEGVRSPGIEVTDGCKPPCGCWELNSSPLGRGVSALNGSAISPALDPELQMSKFKV